MRKEALTSPNRPVGRLKTKLSRRRALADFFPPVDMSNAIFPGTFDPITLGHESLISRVACVFDNIIVGVAAGVHKQAVFFLGGKISAD